MELPKPKPELNKTTSRQSLRDTDQTKHLTALLDRLKPDGFDPTAALSLLFYVHPISREGTIKILTSKFESISEQLAQKFAQEIAFHLMHVYGHKLPKKTHNQTKQFEEL